MFGSPAQRSGAQVFSRGGRSMDAKWTNPGTADGQISLTMHGMCARDFPNMFFTSTDQAGVAAVFTLTLDVFSKHAAFLVSRSIKRLEEKRRVGDLSVDHTVVVEPTAEAETVWANRVLSAAASLPVLAGCTPSYYNAESGTDNMSMDDQIKAAATARWPAGLTDYVLLLEGLWSANDDSDFNIKLVHGPTAPVISESRSTV